MTELSSISREVASLGFKTKSIKAVSTPSGSDAEVSAKFEALKNDGSELIVKGDDNKYYLVELDDSTTLSDLKSKLKAHPSSVVGINFVDKTQKETTGGLYTTYTLEGGSALDKAMASSPKSGSPIAVGKFDAKITDNNGITTNGKDDVTIDVNAEASMTDKDIETLINDNIAGSGVSVKVKISGSGSIDLSLKLDKSTKDKIKQELLAGPLKDLDGLTDGYLSEKLDSIISTLEEHLNSSFTPSEIASMLSGGASADGLISKFRDLLNLKRSDIEKALYDVVKDKLGETVANASKGAISSATDYIEKAYKYVAASAEAKLKSVLKPDNKDPNSVLELLKEVSRVGKYTLSDSSLSKMTTDIKGSLSGGKLVLNFSAKGTVSSDEAKGIVSGSTDSLGVNGALQITSKGSVILEKAGLGITANIDNTKLSQRQIVAMAESMGGKGDLINTGLLKGKASISGTIQADADLGATGIKAKVGIKVDKFTEGNFGTDIKDLSAKATIDYRESPFNLNIKSDEPLSIGKAVLLKGAKLGKDLTINKLELSGTYKITEQRMEELKTNLLASGLDEKTTKDIISKLKGDTTKIYFTKESFEKRVDTIFTVLKIDKEKQPSLKDTILKSAFSSPSMESVEVNLDDTHLTINGKGIETGINLSGQMDKQKGGLILRRVKLDEGNIDANLGTYNVKAEGKKLVLEGLAVMSGGKSVAVNNFYAMSGKIDVNTKGESLRASGSGMGANVVVGNVQTIIDSKGTATLDVSKKGDNINAHLTTSGEFSGKTILTIDKEKKLKEEIEFSGKTGDLDVSANESKIKFKASGKDSHLRIKSKEHNLDIELSIPNGVTAEFDMKTKTLKLKGADGKEFEAKQVIKDYSGKLIADISIKAKGETEAKFDKGIIDIKPPESGVEVNAKIKNGDKDISIKGTFNGKVNIDTENKTLSYDTVAGKDNGIEVETDTKKFSAKTSSETTINMSLMKDNNLVELEAGGTPDKPVEINIKSENTKHRTIETDLNIKVSNKGKIAVARDPQNEDGAVIKITPPAGQGDKSGISIKGRVDTGVAIIDIDNLGISADTDSSGVAKESQATISKNGVEFSGAELNVSGKLGISGDGDIFKDVKFNGKASVKKSSLDFNKMVADASVGFKGTVKGHNVEVQGGLKGSKEKAEYNAFGKFNGSYVTLGGNISSSTTDDAITIQSKNKATVSIGTANPTYYNIDVKDLRIPLKDVPTIFEGTIKLDSADKSGTDFKTNGKLSVGADIKLEKTATGYKMNIKGNLNTKDCLQASLNQLTAIMKQPQIAELLAKRGIKAEDLEKLKEQIYQSLVATDLKTNADISVNIGNDFKAKSIEIKSASVESIKMSVPLLTHTKEHGVRIETRPNEKITFRDKPVSISGNIDMQKREAKANVSVDLNKIMQQVLDKQFSHPDSPIKDKIKFEVRGDKIFIIANNQEKSVNFGLKDIDISVKDNKIHANVKLSWLRAVGDVVGALFKDETNLPREMKMAWDLYWSESSKAVDKSYGLGGVDVTIDIPKMMEEKGVPPILDGNISIKDGVVSVPIKSSF